MKNTLLIACVTLLLATSCNKKDHMPEPARTNTSVEKGWDYPGCGTIKEKRQLAKPQDM